MTAVNYYPSSSPPRLDGVLQGSPGAWSKDVFAVPESPLRDGDDGDLSPSFDASFASVMYVQPDLIRVY